MTNNPFQIIILVAILSLFLFKNLTTSLADNKTYNTESTEEKFVSFGSFEGEGFVYISLYRANVRPFYYKAPPAPAAINLSRIGFFIASSLPYDLIRNAEKKQSCIIDEQNVTPFVTFNDWPPSNSSLLTTKVQIFKDPGSHFVIFQNCVENTLVLMSFLLNFGSKSYANYVYKYYTLLPKVMLVTSILYAILSSIWAFFLCYKTEFSHNFHQLVLVLLVLQLMKQLSQMAPSQLQMKYNIWILLNMVYCIHYESVTFLFFAPIDMLVKPRFKNGRRVDNLPVYLFLLQFIAETLYLFRSFIIQKVCFVLPYDQFIDCWDYIFILAGPIVYSIYWTYLHFKILRLKKEENDEEKNDLTKLEFLWVVYLVLMLHQLIKKVGVMFFFRIIAEYEHWWITLIIHEVVDYLLYLFMCYMFWPCLINERSLWDDNPQVSYLPKHSARVYPEQV